MSQESTPTSEPQEPPPQTPAGVPRRFSLGKLMLLMAVFAVVFALMRCLKFPPLFFIEMTVFFMGIAVAQPILFGGTEPRAASFVAGMVLAPLVSLLPLLLAMFSRPTDDYLEECYGYACLMSFLGGPLGYVAGCLIASVFLIRERDE